MLFRSPAFLCRDPATGPSRVVDLPPLRNELDVANQNSPPILVPNANQSTSGWPSGLRRQTQGVFLHPNDGREFWSSIEGVGSNPTPDITLLDAFIGAIFTHRDNSCLFLLYTTTLLSIRMTQLHHYYFQSRVSRHLVSSSMSLLR